MMEYDEEINIRATIELGDVSTDDEDEHQDGKEKDTELSKDHGNGN